MPTMDPTDFRNKQNSLAKAYARESNSINDTPLRRFLVLAALKIWKTFSRQLGGVTFLPGRICVKYSSLAEASTLQFISQHTSIPVPQVYCSFIHKDQTYIVMQKIQGEMLAHGWISRTAESKAKIHSQLREMVAEMRKLPPVTCRVSNVDGGILYDGRIDGPMNFGPFENIQKFHQYLRGGLAAHETNLDDVKELIAWHDGTWNMPVFTHGDLSSLNILARGDKVVGIVDWETSGWYPDYWEYTTAKQTNPFNLFWKDEIDSFLEPLPKAQAMEEIRQRYFGDY
ncbi:hypothetical protein GcM1_174015 [Golovinomyces cichoracearum]|uniref:Aminoglycoside phosphotransferase domain-containing protein n=1 Tax=Golovinomyces cichoracearum TaxID=62708 RepID=A0A420J5T4_9PEZI|nr:hypothetical protein GcM1_174015 [Golovinomyces cichoracearum]